MIKSLNHLWPKIVYFSKISYSLYSILIKTYWETYELGKEEGAVWWRRRETKLKHFHVLKWTEMEEVRENDSGSPVGVTIAAGCTTTYLNLFRVRKRHFYHIRSPPHIICYLPADSLLVYFLSVYRNGIQSKMGRIGSKQWNLRGPVAQVWSGSWTRMEAQDPSGSEYWAAMIMKEKFLNFKSCSYHIINIMCYWLR